MLQTVAELAVLIAVVGLCSLAFSSGGRDSWIRRPSLTQDLAETPRLFQCMKDLVGKTGANVSRLRFSGPLLTKDRVGAQYFVYLGPGEAPYRLDFAALTGQKWRYFAYGEDSRIGAFTGRMETKANLIDRSDGKTKATLDLLPCASFLGQGVGHGA